MIFFFFFSSRRRHTRLQGDWSSDVCSSDLGAGDTGRAQFWSGLRPATPSNVPLIGRSPIANLFLNTGHGTLGWTHACGSGMALADLVSGRQPAVDFDFLGAAAMDPDRSAGTVRPRAV